jgi:hypothetical protein
MALASGTRLGPYEMYIRPFPNVDAGQWQISTGGGAEPLWAPGRKELFYRDPTRLMVVPIEPGTIPRLGKPEELFNLGRYTASSGRDYHIMPTGDRFVFAAPLSTEGTHIVLVDNWAEELKRLVPTN